MVSLYFQQRFIKAVILLSVFLQLFLLVNSNYIDNDERSKYYNIETDNNQRENFNSSSTTCSENIEWTNNDDCLIGPVSIKEDIASDVFYQLCPRSVGMFEVPSSCDLYVSCHFEQLTINRCPPSYHFQQTEQQCVPSEMSACTNPVGKHPSSAFETRNKRFVSNLDNLSESRNAFIHRLEKREAVVKGRFVGKCPEDFIQPDPNDCTQFQICSSNGQLYNQKCGPGTLFNPLSKVCDMPENVDCESSMSDFGTYACPKDAHYITTHYEDCTKFIECFDGSLKIKSCSGDLVFNPEKGICDYKYQTECQEPISLEHDTDVNYSSIKQQRQRPKRSDEILNQKYECEFNYIAPVENSCNQFIECENGYLFKKTCGPGTAYNPLLGQCDWPYNVRSPDARYCSAYLQCDGKRFVPKKCHPGTAFNPFNGKCEPENRVDCTGKVDDPKRRQAVVLNRSR